MTKFVIMAQRHIGKTTLAERIIRDTDRKVYGFFTRKFPDRKKGGRCPLYIFPAGSDPIFDDEHLAGFSDEESYSVNLSVFDTVGVKLLTVDDPNGLIIMDEVGFMESKAEKFREKVFECLSGDIPVVLMMKFKLDEEFMQQIAAFPDAEFVVMNEENRDGVYARIRSELNSSVSE